MALPRSREAFFTALQYAVLWSSYTAFCKSKRQAVCISVMSLIQKDLYPVPPCNILAP